MLRTGGSLVSTEAHLLFQIFNEYVAKVIKAKPSMETSTILSMQVSKCVVASHCFEMFRVLQFMGMVPVCCVVYPAVRVDELCGEVLRRAR